MLRTAAALGAAVVVGRSAARHQHQHQRIHAESATAAPATPKKQLKPIYDPAPPKDVDADVDADEQQQQQYVYLVNDEVPVTSPVRMLRETVQTVYGIVKAQVETAQVLATMARGIHVLGSEFVSDIYHGRRTLIFGDKVYPHALIYTWVVLGSSLYVRTLPVTTKTLAWRWLLTPTVSVAAFPFAFPNTTQHVLAHVENSLGFSLPTPTRTYNQASDIYRSTKEEVQRLVKYNRGEAKTENRGTVVDVNDIAKVPTMTMEDAVNEMVALSTNPEGHHMVQVVDSIAFDESTDGDVDATAAAADTGAASPSENENLDMYTVRSTDIGPSTPSESPDTD